MTLRVTTTHEKLVEIEHLIEQERLLQRVPGNRADVLKAIAADYRSRLDGKPSVSLVEIEHRVVSVARSKVGGHYGNGQMICLAQVIVGRWPVIKMALEKFGAEVEQA